MDKIRELVGSGVNFVKGVVKRHPYIFGVAVGSWITLGACNRVFEKQEDRNKNCRRMEMIEVSESLNQCYRDLNLPCYTEVKCDDESKEIVIQLTKYPTGGDKE